MATRCVQGGESFADDRRWCDDHCCGVVDVPADSAGDAGPDQAPGGADPREATDGSGRTAWDTATCWRCGTRSPNPANTECLDPACRRSLTPPVLHVRFADGEVELDREQRTPLGRHGPNARAFRDFPNVSREHAVLGVDAAGTAWIQPLRTPNGTFLNDVELTEPSHRALFSGDSVRLAKDATGTVTVYER